MRRGLIKRIEEHALTFGRVRDILAYTFSEIAPRRRRALPSVLPTSACPRSFIDEVAT
jgi:hypothetical protein